MRAVLWWWLVLSATQSEEKHKGFFVRIRDFFHSWIKEMKKDTKKALKREDDDY